MSTKKPSGDRGTASSASRRLHARSCEHAQSISPGVMFPVLSWWTSSVNRYSCSIVQGVAFGTAPASVVGMRSTPSSVARRNERCTSAHFAGIHRS
jgi:hypothetical protein